MDIFNHTFKINIKSTKLRRFARAKDCFFCMVQCGEEYKIDKNLNTMYTLQILDGDKWVDSMVCFDKEFKLYEYVTHIFGDSFNTFQPSEYEIEIKNKL